MKGYPLVRAKFECPGHPRTVEFYGAQTREMVAVPQVDEQIYFGETDNYEKGHTYTVKRVVHYPDDPDLDVYVVLRY